MDERFAFRGTRCMAVIFYQADMKASDYFVASYTPPLSMILGVAQGARLV